MVANPFFRRRGESLVETLMAFAIAASMLGIVFPMVSGEIHKARVGRARKDLNVISGAIRRWEMTNSSLLTGARLEPLLNGTLSSLPEDPWGNDYFFDGNLGVLGSFAADGIQGGTEADKDLTMLFRGEIATLKATMSPGRFGFVRAGDRFVIQLSKPVLVLETDDDLAEDFDLLLPHDGAYPLSLAFLGFAYRQDISHPEVGELIFQAQETPPPARRVAVAGGSRIAVSGFPLSLQEAPLPTQITRIDWPEEFMRGSETSVRADGSWSGAELRVF